MMKPAATPNMAPPLQSLTTIRIEKAPSELYKVLKFKNLVQRGGETKSLISRGFVRVNGAIETRKRKKIVSGDVIAFAEQAYRVAVSRGLDT
jgi:ribosome-associated protein